MLEPRFSQVEAATLGRLERQRPMNGIEPKNVHGGTVAQISADKFGRPHQ